MTSYHNSPGFPGSMFSNGRFLADKKKALKMHSMKRFQASMQAIP
jgi:hypothetical protein